MNQGSVSVIDKFNSAFYRKGQIYNPATDLFFLMDETTGYSYNERLKALKYFNTFGFCGRNWEKQTGLKGYQMPTLSDAYNAASLLVQYSEWLNSITTFCAYYNLARAAANIKYMQDSRSDLLSFTGDTGNSTTRVGRWMSEAEYNKMVSTGKVQMSPNGNTAYVTNPADTNAFRAATNGSVYVEFDVPTSSIYPAGNEYWGQISGPGSYWDRMNQGRGMPAIIDIPDATNIQIIGGK